MSLVEPATAPEPISSSGSCGGKTVPRASSSRQDVIIKLALPAQCDMDLGPQAYDGYAEVAAVFDAQERQELLLPCGAAPGPASLGPGAGAGAVDGAGEGGSYCHAAAFTAGAGAGPDAACGAHGSGGAAGAAGAAHASLAAAGAAVPDVRATRLLRDFDEKCKNGEWPASTSVCCYWCCHRFESVPVGIPVAYDDDQGKFMVVGCFCGCECAAAFNLFETRESADELLARHSLLNALARALGYTARIRPAPSRLALSMFGGPLAIDDFRAYSAPGSASQRTIVVNFPPMVTQTQQVEEIAQRELRSEYRAAYVPLDSERVDKYRTKLSRKNPLVRHGNTLDQAMNLTFQPVVELRGGA